MSPPPPPMAARRRGAAVLAGVGVLVALIGIAVVAPVFVLGQRTTGTVLAVDRDSRGQCAPVLGYQVEERTFRVASYVRVSADCDWEIGRKVTVHYWPDEPQRAATFSVASVVGVLALPVLCFIVALWFALVKPLPGT